jgi:hypothetical protein
MCGIENPARQESRKWRVTKAQNTIRPRLNITKSREAAKHHEAGSHEKAAHHSEIAAGHGLHATHHTEEATKHHAEEHTGTGKTAAAA